MHGKVIKSTGSWYEVRTDDGRIVECKVKGNFRLRGIRSTNPVAVGDGVTIKEQRTEGKEETTAFITEIDERRNYIIRKASNLSKQSHILAANVDMALLVVTIARPETSTTFIDRFLASRYVNQSTRMARQFEEFAKGSGVHTCAMGIRYLCRTHFGIGYE